MGIKVKNRIDIDVNYCSGCLGCVNACPTKAMSVVEDKDGFIIPYISDDLCIDCGKCIKVCDFIKEKPQSCNIQEAYSLAINDKDVLFNSTSGGAFTALSDAVLNKGGLIIGAVLEPDFTVRHIVAENKQERDRMRGSKYVQSDTGTIYSQLKQYLKQDKYVMFVGAPCQTAGLLQFLGKPYKNLLTVDFLCHGWPSNSFFKEHIKNSENRINKRIQSYSFRSKVFGWMPADITSVEVRNMKKKYKFQLQSFFSFFANNYSLRPSCFNCKYRSHYRYSDITIADFWGIEKLTSKKDRKGTSLVLINSEKGSELFQRIQNECSIQQFPVEDILFRVSTKTVKQDKRSEFWQLYHEKGYDALVDKYYNQSNYKKFRFLVKKIVKRQTARF